MIWRPQSGRDEHSSDGTPISRSTVRTSRNPAHRRSLLLFQRAEIMCALTPIEIRDTQSAKCQPIVQTQKNRLLRRLTH